MSSDVLRATTACNRRGRRLPREGRDVPGRRASRTEAVGLLVILLLAANALEARAQQRTFQEAAPALRVAVPADGSAAHVYHNLALPAGYGIVVYRQQEGGEPVRLNEMPLSTVMRGSELRYRLGRHYDAVLEAVQRDDPTAALFALRRDAFAAGLLSMIYPEVADLLARRFVDTDAPVGSRVTYRVQVVDDQGRPTGQLLENEVRLTPTRPPAPQHLSAEARNGWLRLTWDFPLPSASADDGVIFFNVYDAEDDALTTPLNPRPILRTSNERSYQFAIEAPPPGTDASFVVVAVDFLRQPGEPSEVIRIRIEDQSPPGPVQAVEARVLEGARPASSNPGGAVVEVTWQPNTEADLAGYQVYRSRSATADFAPIHDSPLAATQTAILDEVPPGSHPYFYRVLAVDHAGNAGDASSPGMVFVRDRVAPSAPQALEAQFEGSGTVQLRWIDPDPAPDLWTYIVLRRRLSGNAGPAYDQVNLEDLRRTAFVDRGEASAGFVEGAFYEYVVLAADSSRNFSDSAFVRIQIPDRTPPDPPALVRAQSDEGFRVNLTWDATRATDAVQYVVYRATSSGRDSVIARTPIARRFIRDEAVAVGQTYAYRVTAVDSVGNEGRPSDPAVHQLRDNDPPRTVRNVRARLGGAGVELQWEPVLSPDLAGYRVYRSNLPTGVFEPVHSELVTDTRWIDRGSSSGAWYRVRAVDTSGNESRASAPAGATTQASAP